MSKITQPPILITGCARSGTSMVAGIINLCGAFGGIMSGPNHNNRKGMFENIKIRNELIKPYLMKLKADRLGQYPLPDIKNLFIYISLGEKIENIMIEQGYKNGLWMYKGAKMCLIWPTLNFTFPDAKWVIVRRKTDDIVNSCLNTGFMKAFKRIDVQKQIGVNNEIDGWKWWVNQHKKRFNEMESSNLNIRYIWPEKMVYEDYTEIKEVIEWLGLKWNNKVYEFITPKLWKSKRKLING